MRNKCLLYTVLLWKRSSIDLSSVYCFTCLQWKKWHQCHFLDPHADAYLTKTVKFGQISKISVVLECLQQLQQDFSEVHPLYGFRNVFLSKNFYFFFKIQKWSFFVIKFLSTWYMNKKRGQSSKTGLEILQNHVRSSHLG